MNDKKDNNKDIIDIALDLTSDMKELKDKYEDDIENVASSLGFDVKSGGDDTRAQGEETEDMIVMAVDTGRPDLQSLDGVSVNASSGEIVVDTGDVMYTMDLPNVANISGMETTVKNGIVTVEVPKDGN